MSWSVKVRSRRSGEALRQPQSLHLECRSAEMAFKLRGRAAEKTDNFWPLFCEIIPDDKKGGHT